MRFLSWVRWRTSIMRVRGRSRWSRSSPGGIQTVGRVPLRWSWLRPRTSSLSVLLISPTSSCALRACTSLDTLPAASVPSTIQYQLPIDSPAPGEPAHIAPETAGALPAHAGAVVRGRADRPAEPPTPGCNVCGHRTRYIPSAAPPLAADAVECCPTPTVISPWAEAQRFHPIKGRWFKSSPRNQVSSEDQRGRGFGPFGFPRSAMKLLTAPEWSRPQPRFTNPSKFASRRISKRDDERLPVHSCASYVPWRKPEA